MGQVQQVSYGCSLKGGPDINGGSNNQLAGILQFGFYTDRPQQNSQLPY